MQVFGCCMSIASSTLLSEFLNWHCLIGYCVEGQRLLLHDWLGTQSLQHDIMIHIYCTVVSWCICHAYWEGPIHA
jgi:hypothetical protein